MSKKTLSLHLALLLVAGGLMAPVVLVFLDIFLNTLDQPGLLLYFVSSAFLTKAWNSLVLALSVTIGASLIGVCNAAVFFHLEGFGRRAAVLLLLLLLFAVSPVIFLVILTRYESFNNLPAFCQAVAVLSLNLCPITSILLIFGLGSIDPTSLEIAFLSSTLPRTARRILLPQLLAPLAIGGMIVFVQVLTRQEVPSFLGYRTYAEEFLSRVIVMVDPGEAAVAAAPYLLVAGAVIVLLRRLTGKTHLHHLLEQTHLPLSLRFPGRLPFPVVGWLFTTLLLAMLPLILLRHISLSGVPALLSANVDAMQNSLFLAVIPASLATLLAWCGYALFSSGRAKKLGTALAAILLLSWLTPPSLTALGLIRLSRMVPFGTGSHEYPVLLFGSLIKLLPMAVLFLAGLELVRKRPDDTVARLLKISRLDRLTKLTLPLTWPLWLLTATVLTILALNDLAVTVLLIPPGVETLVIRIYNLMHYGDYSLVAFLALVQVLLVAALVAATALLLRINDKA